ncbi:hypothetical protein BD779DRAFT_785065 [Infundibulicybe gibba]|nr:hypothetical protein BD779DRAFT_785065 [Infundibulicybe gibba]
MSWVWASTQITAGDWRSGDRAMWTISGLEDGQGLGEPLVLSIHMNSASLIKHDSCSTTIQWSRHLTSNVADAATGHGGSTETMKVARISSKSVPPTLSQRVPCARAYGIIVPPTMCLPGFSAMPSPIFKAFGRGSPRTQGCRGQFISPSM